MDEDTPRDKADEASPPDSGETDLTRKQELFVQHYTDPSSPGFSNATKSAELAGYKGQPGSNQLAVQGCENLRKPNVRRVIADILEDAACTPELAAQRLKESLDAVTVRPFMSKQGLVYSEPAPDYKERRQAAEFVLKLHAMERNSQEQVRFGEQGESDASIQRHPIALAMSKLDAVDRNLIVDATQKVLDMIQYEKEAILEERSGVLSEDELHEEAWRRVTQQLGWMLEKSPPNEVRASTAGDTLSAQ